MYKIITSQDNDKIENELNKLEKEGYDFIACVGLSKFGYVGVSIIMHKKEDNGTYKG